MVDRYKLEEIAKIWTEERKYETWLKIEILALKAYSKINPKITASDISKIEKRAKIDVSDILEIEVSTKHDMIAFTRSISKQLGEEKKWVHYGLTSTDVVDTALSALIKEANEFIAKKLDDLRAVLRNLALEHEETYQMGRTHGMHAEVTTFGYKMALWFEEIERNIERFNLARKQIEVGKISGAVGNYANIPIEISEYICKELGLGIERISTQTLQRDRHANYIFSLALICSSLDKFAIELRHLQRTEVGEVEEAFSKGQKGSSAMPHKRNPISSENISGLSRLVRGFVFTSLENIPLWHERDISHSSNERIIISDATMTTYYILVRFTNIIKNLKINKEKMLENIYLTNSKIFSQQVLLYLIEIKNYNRENAYDLVQSLVFEATNLKIDFKNYLIDKKILDKSEIDEIFSLEKYKKNISKIFQKIGIKD